MIAIIRIHGMIKVKQNVDETLSRLKLRKKYTCAIVNETPEMIGMIQEVKDFVAFGKIDEKTLTEIIKMRGKKIGNTKAKISEAEAQKAAKEVASGKRLEDLGIKPFFGLHPARGGIDTKHHFPKGVLGSHKDKLNELIQRML
jgi:large subunit ribosomal protein L30